MRFYSHKLIWYPAGNLVQLFDLELDPGESRNVADVEGYARIRKDLESALVKHAWGVDLGWIDVEALAGFDAGPFVYKPDRAWGGQRGLHYPPPPLSDPSKLVGAPG